MLNQALAYATAHADQHLQELLDYVSIPSVSAQPAHARDTRYAALWLSEHLRDLGLKADVMETGGNPVVYAEWLGKPGAPTVLIYGHYDVQPAEPLELWHSEPFKPVIRDGFIYGRGSDDNKGQHFARKFSSGHGEDGSARLGSGPLRGGQRRKWCDAVRAPNVGRVQHHAVPDHQLDAADGVDVAGRVAADQDQIRGTKLRRLLAEIL